MDAIVTAGGLPHPKDPLFSMTQGGYKAMLDLGGKPMIQWVLDSLSQSDKIGHVVVVGLPLETPLQCSHPLQKVLDQGDMVRNIQAGVAYLDTIHPQDEHCLVVSSDIPGLQPEMIDWLVETVSASHFDVYYTVIERSVMEKRFPESRRTYARLKNGSFCGGDANAINKEIARKENAFTTRLIEARKNPLKQASLVGYGTLLRLMLGSLSLENAVSAVCKRMGITGQAIRCPYAEVGMDVDKPFQYDIVRADLEKKHRL
jgi:GTP:adenosylcobinamide-phosphate guanylyltransferase